MTVPLDRLYYFIQNLAKEVFQDNTLIYRFIPHGSKNINDLKPLYSYSYLESVTVPAVYCFDQEPLNYDYYCQHSPEPFHELGKKLSLMNKRNMTFGTSKFLKKDTFHSKALLLHSELNSKDVEKYQASNEVVPVYYWNHALLARDWFRYAQHEKFSKEVSKTFLIYNRAWSGTREYRLRFVDLLVEHQLIEHCMTSFNPKDPETGLHYENYTYHDPQWKPQNRLEDFLTPTSAESGCSADFVTDDYNATQIEIVLETLFDQPKIQLTEKSLRPIACAQPFVLIGPTGSLKYLQDYGFKTYSEVWNEDYDNIQDPALRLNAVVDLMKQISQWDDHTRASKMKLAQAIAMHNQQWFFDHRFFDLVVDELKSNLRAGFEQVQKSINHDQFFSLWQELLSYNQVVDFLDINQEITAPTRSVVDQLMRLCVEKKTI